MRKKMKRAIIVSGTICMLSMTMIACGSGPGTDVTAESASDSSLTPETDDGTSQDQGEEPGRTQAPAANTDSAQAAQAETDKSSTPSNSEQNNGDTTAAYNGNSGKWHVLDPETAKLVDADFEGTVWKIGDGTFYISEESTEVMDDGSMVSTAASSDAAVADSDLLQVVYDNNTHFCIRTIYDNGARYEDSEATSGHLEQGASVSLKGTIKDDIFYAEEVRISKLK